MKRRGVVVKNPYRHLTSEEIELIHQTSLDLLAKPGILCYSEESASLMEQAGACLTPTREGVHKAWWVSIPATTIYEALESTPSKVILGARKPENILILDAEEGRVHFGSGSEANYWLEVFPEEYISCCDARRTRILPITRTRRGNIDYLSRSAHLADHFEHQDFFLRNVNVQDADISKGNKDVNVFFASLNNTTKHVMSGLVDLSQLKNVVRMAKLIVESDEKFQTNPIVSFITSVIKSPLQLLDETAQKLMAISRLGLPVVISTSPQGGSTAPVDETGMVAQVNAEVLAGILVNQLTRPGAPVIYGAVPVRARMDDLHDMYGAPEFCRYNLACAQMARYYKVPCYSTAGVGDARVPGLQAAAEKMFTHAVVPSAAPGLVHYAFGLLNKTQTFSPEQAVLDNHHIGMVKFLYRETEITPEAASRTRKIVNEVMHSPYRLYSRYARQLMRQGQIWPTYPFESNSDDHDQTLINAHRHVQDLVSRPAAHLQPEACARIFKEIPGILPRLNPYR